MNTELKTLLKVLEDLGKINTYEITIKSGNKTVSFRPLEALIDTEKTLDEVEEWFDAEDERQAHPQSEEKT
jgi:hypothetical protein|tara:strand:- start:575 stop:787 length:213 start_codon:yes stop_codon:yes gene_type:complete